MCGVFLHEFDPARFNLPGDYVSLKGGGIQYSTGTSHWVGEGLTRQGMAFDEPVQQAQVQFRWMLKACRHKPACAQRYITAKHQVGVTDLACLSSVASRMPA
jgi:hypothetical protein